jgi:F-type H+-transporting ATPase subunit a
MESEQSKNFFEKSYDRIADYVRRNPRRSAVYAGSIVLFLIGFFVPVEPPHVSLSGEPIFSGGPAWLTNSLITTVLVDLIIIVMALAATVRMKEIPGRWQNLIEAMLEYLYGLSESVAGREARRFFPWVVTIFLLVIISNWSGLIPGVGSVGFYHEDASEHALAAGAQLAMADGKLILTESAAAAGAEEGHAKFVPLLRAPSADLNMTFALAIVTMVMVQVWGVRALGAGYFGKFFNFRGDGFMRYVNGFVGILELVSEFSRVIAFGFRLFGNIFAGEIVLATMAFLITFWLPIPFYVLEIFVGFVQAMVFMMLALVFFSMATISHGHEHGH